LGHRRKLTVRNDQVVDEGNTDDPPRRCDTFGDALVLDGRGGVAAWVIVGQDDTTGSGGQSDSENLPRVHDGEGVVALR
jgi:hypothetical protein